MKKVLILIDKILNPRATTEPFYYCDKIEGQQIYDLSSFDRHWIVREFNEGNKHWIWCIRWL